MSDLFFKLSSLCCRNNLNWLIIKILLLLFFLFSGQKRRKSHVSFYKTLVIISVNHKTYDYYKCFFRTTLARWRAAQLGETKKEERRPYLASSCRSLYKCQKWRRQVISEIAKKVAQIQNGNFFILKRLIC